MATLTVGLSGQQFSTIAAAVAASADGDTVAVTADHVYNNDFFYIGHSLTLQAVGGEVQLAANGSGAFGKAAIVEGVPGANIAINGFDISGVAVADGNGAAIRYEGGNLSLSDDYFHNNQEGLLGNGDDPTGNINVHHSEFAFNGNGSGFTHNFYAGAIASVYIEDSYFHDAIIGHEIKSRATYNTIEDNRIFDNNTDSSYSIDLPNGGTATVSGNTIEQGPNSENNAIFAYGEEGVTVPGTLSIDSNLIVNDREGGYGVLGGPATFTNNQLWNLSDLGNATGSNNVDLASRPSLDTSSLSFIAAPAPTPPPVSPPPAPPPEEPPPPSAPAPAPEPEPPPSVPVPEPEPSPPPAPVPTPEPPPVSPPPPSLTLDQYHTMVATDFLAYFADHPNILHSQGALKALSFELNSPVVLTSPAPGDLWSH